MAPGAKTLATVLEMSGNDVGPPRWEKGSRRSGPWYAPPILLFKGYQGLFPWR